MTVSFEVVIPTIGRPSLSVLLRRLHDAAGPRPERFIVVDDRRHPEPALDVDDDEVAILRGGGRGPAAARNVGWRAASAEWIAFLDDDVVPDSDWLERLVEDLRDLPSEVAASQGIVRVPLPADRAPTDRERNVAGLADAPWITADCAYRRSALREVGGFDERFRRAYREDADLALRVMLAGYRLVKGTRAVAHPVRPADQWISVRLQAGNADDVLMRRLHGRGWRTKVNAPRGRRGKHIATVAAAALGVAGLATRSPALARVGLLGWVAGTAELAWARIAPGPRTADEIGTMLCTSAAIPFAATGHWIAGLARSPRAPWPIATPETRAAPQAWDPRRSGAGSDPRRSEASARGERPRAVLFDRDGTLVLDVPYNGDPTRVVPMPGAREALDKLRAAGIRLGVVSNQSGVARGLITQDQVELVNRRIEQELGPLGVWVVCPHAPEDRCGCRKPAPGLIHQAAKVLGVEPSRVAVVGDIGSDVEAARAVGARAILVPTPRTLHEEIQAAPEVARDLLEAVEVLLADQADQGDAS